MQNIMIHHQERMAEHHTGVLTRKASISYTDLLEDKVERYMEKLGDFEKRCLQSGVDREKLLDEITLLNDSILQACADFEVAAQGNTELVKAAQERFREQTHSLLSKSYFITHARTWPQGYQGDYSMLEGVYRNIPLAQGIGYYLDRYSLSTALGNAVRERRMTLRSLLSAELDIRKQPKILDVACGSCREIFELAPEIKKAGAKFTCVDFDAEALDFAADRMAYVGIPDHLTEFRKYNALKMINPERNVKEFGLQDVVYSVGFFDYLDDDTLVRLLGSLYMLLNPGGRLITSFKDCRKYSSQYYHWMVDWNGFFRRTEEDCRELLDRAGIPLDSAAPLREKSGVIMFFTATR